MDTDPLQDAIRKSPDNLPLLIYAAQTYEADFDLAKAADAWSRILKITPADSSAAIAASRCLRALNRDADAFDTLQACLALSPSPESSSQLSSLLEDIASSTLDPDLRQSLQLRLSGKSSPPPGRPAIDFSRVAGMQECKQQLRQKIIEPLRNPQLYAQFGLSAGGGVLMYGPPGCGKTYLSRALAGEVDAPFTSIGIDEILSLWIGESEKQLHEVFAQARLSRPHILFFDEIDALGTSRANLRASGLSSLINQFLTELDGSHDNSGILTIGATNAPWNVDSALLRPGRFDRVIFVPPPDAEARAGIFRLELEGKPHDPDDIDFSRLAAKTREFSGADIRGVVQSALQAALDLTLKSGSLTPVSRKLLEAAIAQARPTTLAWLQQAKNYVEYANADGMYNDLAAYLKSSR